MPTGKNGTTLAEQLMPRAVAKAAARLVDSLKINSVTEKMPGKTLWEHLEQGTLTRQMVEAAGHEFRRAHQFWSDEFRDGWSHGDAGTNNVIFDKHTGRARLIDFEICHNKSLEAKARHADDLLVFLLDLIAVAPNPQWLALSLSFLNAY